MSISTIGSSNSQSGQNAALVVAAITGTGLLAAGAGYLAYQSPPKSTRPGEIGLTGGSDRATVGAADHSNLITSMKSTSDLKPEKIAARLPEESNAGVKILKELQELKLKFDELKAHKTNQTMFVDEQGTAHQAPSPQSKAHDPNHTVFVDEKGTAHRAPSPQPKARRPNPVLVNGQGAAHPAPPTQPKAHKPNYNLFIDEHGTVHRAPSPPVIPTR